jgi:hypothetical protein
MNMLVQPSKHCGLYGLYKKCLTILEMIRFGLGKNHGKNIINTTGEHGGWKTIKHGI